MAKNSRKAKPLPEPEAGASAPHVTGAARPDSDSHNRDSQAAEITARLLAHYRIAHRDLPWRQDTDPYRVWVSEVMLQQTRVETVVPYYLRWLERFPTLAALANAPDDDVMKQWEGLGYYSRARNLQRAARMVRERHGGDLPSDPQLLRELPGFGDYTVGAVASIAFGHALPAVDGNVRRVLARLFDVARPAPAWLRETAATLVPQDAPGDFNQALMEFGATVCKPRSPRCPGCPLEDLCLARASGTVAERPGRRPRATARAAAFAVALLSDGAGRLLLVRNGDTGLLAGMWGLPCTEVRPGEGVAAAAARAAREAGVRVEAISGRQLPSVRHNFTHLRATYRPIAFVIPGRRRAARKEARWVSADGVAAAPLPVAHRKVVQLPGCPGGPS